MAQKFTSFEDAAKQLSISKDRLNQLREAGVVRAYRDGQSWKFRSEDIEKLATEGIPPVEVEPSDLALDLDGSSDEIVPLSAEPSGLDLELAGEETTAGATGSDLNLEEIEEPTVAGVEESDQDALAIDLDEQSISMADSILMNEAELGTSSTRPPSTIIGKAELDLDADLDLAPVDDATSGRQSDVKLASPSDILPLEEDTGLELPSPSGDFEGLPEVDIDLEAESSRILSAEDVAKVKAAAATAKQAAESSDLQLAPSDSVAGSEVGVGSEPIGDTNAGLTGLSALELEEDEESLVLGEGSDVTLSGESSGINIISPSDSGLALDDVSLDLGGSSPIGSSLDLGSSLSQGSNVAELGLEPLGVGEGAAASQIGEEFQLTPLGEEDLGEEEKDSSQVIELEGITEEGFGGLSGEAGVSEEEIPVGGLGVGLPGESPVGAVAAVETPFSMWNVVGLGSCLLLLALCGMMTFDLLRNIWSWDDVTPLSSTLLEAFARLFRLM
jgi:excisionase family DNA binding protein